MDPIARMVAAGAAGAAGGGDSTYVDDVFSTFLYEASGSTTQTITNGIDLAGEGGMVWIKNRANGSTYTNHTIVDSERGANSYGYRSIYPNLTEAQFEPTSSSNAVATTFNSDGFTRGGNLNVSVSGGDYVTWTFRKAPGFFDVVTYTGSGSVQNISHSLGSVPGMIIVKGLYNGSSWNVYHRSLGANGVIYLNGTFGNSVDNGVWNNTAPTSSVFTVGADAGVNGNGQSYVAYLFAHDDAKFGADEDEAIIKCDSYTGNYSTDGPEIDLGFELQFLLLKRADNSDDWFMVDNMRGLPKMQALYPNENRHEQDWGNTYIRFTSTGFKLTTQNSMFNNNGEKYIYMAIRRPHKPPTAGTDVFALDATSASGTTGNAFDAPFPVDMAMEQRWGTSDNKYIAARLSSGKYMVTNTTAAEVSSNNITFDTMDGVWTAFNNTEYSAQMFKRAPGFFDVVAYTGSNNSGSTSYTHNLEVVPELIIFKVRNAGGQWYVYSSVLGSSKYLTLNGNQAEGTQAWTTPTATQFTAFAGINATHENYIVYLFATLDGISKVGSYSGTGSNINVDCGFTAGARFVLIKRTDSSGDWYMWDTAHGINPGNDPYIRLNDGNAQVTNTDYIDPLNAGFTVTSNAPAALNANGGTYLFLAIA